MSKKSIGLIRRVQRKASLLLNREIKSFTKYEFFEDICIDIKFYTITYKIESRHNVNEKSYVNVSGFAKTKRHTNKNGNVVGGNSTIYCYYNKILKRTLFLYNEFKFTGISYNTLLSYVIERVVLHEARHIYQHHRRYNTFNGRLLRNCREIDADIFAFVEMIKRKDSSFVSLAFDKRYY